jgi:hypothetical protein
MGSSALEIIFISVFSGVVCGIVAGMAILAVMNAVEALVNRLDVRRRSVEVVHRSSCVAPR